MGDHIEDRIRRWCETPLRLLSECTRADVAVDLLSEAEEELRRLRAQLEHIEKSDAGAEVLRGMARLALEADHE